MSSMNLAGGAADLLAAAAAAGSGRAARTLHGGRAHPLRQTLLALTAGRGLADHENPGDATLQVLVGRVRLTAGGQSWEGNAGDYLHIPPQRHGLHAVHDAVVLLTVVAATGAHP